MDRVGNIGGDRFDRIGSILPHEKVGMWRRLRMRHRHTEKAVIDSLLGKTG